MRFHVFPSFVFVPLFIILLTGCSQNVKVSGKVVFDDGAPLETGVVVCSDGKAEYLGRIGAGGTYSMGVLKDGTGIPKGTYAVCIRGAEEQTGRIVKLTGPSREEVDEPERYCVVENKFTDHKLSGLTITVPSGDYTLKAGQKQPIPPPNPKSRYAK